VLLLGLVTAGTASAQSMTVYVPRDRPTIQEGVEHACAIGAARVEVRARITPYVENITYDCPRRIDLVAQGQQKVYLTNEVDAPTITVVFGHLRIIGLVVNNDSRTDFTANIAAGAGTTLDVHNSQLTCSDTCIAAFHARRVIVQLTQLLSINTGFARAVALDGAVSVQLYGNRFVGFHSIFDGEDDAGVDPYVRSDNVFVGVFRVPAID
jgi:hypothetical protein